LIFSDFAMGSVALSLRSPKRGVLTRNYQLAFDSRKIKGWKWNERTFMGAIGGGEAVPLMQRVSFGQGHAGRPTGTTDNRGVIAWL
jgi:hypothetical protein